MKRLQLWKLSELDLFFLIPENVVKTPGNDVIVNFQNEKRLINKDNIQEYTCTKEQAHTFLRQQWNNTLAEAKKAWLQLYQFSKITGIDQDMEKMKEGFLSGLKSSGADVEQAFDAGKNMVEQLNQAVKDSKNQSEAEQQEAFKNVFQNLPEVLSFFDKDNLEAASKDPEAWAKELYQTAFSEAEKKKAEKKKQQLKDDVRNSIAKGLRKAGVTPSSDFK